MNLSAGYPLWLIRDGIPFDYPKLERHARADVVVIGGGISGALMAYYLQHAGVDTMVVDGRTVGFGSTCASTSLLQYEIDTPLSRLQQMIGERNANRAYVLCADAIGKLSELAGKTGFSNFSGARSIYYAASTSHIPLLLEELDARKKAGLDLHWLDEQDLAKQFGINAPAAIISSLAAQTDAYGLTHALHQYNIARGVAVYDRNFITHTDTRRNGLVLTTREGYHIRCKKLVYATGYETVNLLDKKIVKLISTYAVAGEQSTASVFPVKDILLWSTATPYLYARTTADQRVIVGGRDEDYYSPGKRDALIMRKTRQLSDDIRKLVPGIEFRPEFSWAGTFGSTKDGLPFIGAYQPLPHCFFALGFGGNGITFSQVAAEIVTALIKGKKHNDAALFSFDRIA
jgi:glycine/D-amino acid oxidase-like deaminating enzyme